MIPLLAILAWVSLLLLITALCVAARRGDEHPAEAALPAAAPAQAAPRTARPARTAAEQPARREPVAA